MNFDFQTATFVALATFGAVHLIAYVLDKRFDIILASDARIYLSVILAFAFAFVPADFASELATKIKDAIAVAIALNGTYQFLGGVAKKVNS